VEVVKIHSKKGWIHSGRQVFQKKVPSIHLDQNKKEINVTPFKLFYLKINIRQHTKNSYLKFVKLGDAFFTNQDDDNHADVINL